MLQNIFYRAGLQSRVKRNGQGIKITLDMSSERFVADFLLSLFDDKFLFEYVCRCRLENAFCNFSLKMIY
jgi:hypothetical protein